MKKAERQKTLKNLKEILELIVSDYKLQYEVTHSLTENEWGLLYEMYNTYTDRHDFKVVKSISEITSKRRFTYEDENGIDVTIYLYHIVSSSILREIDSKREFIRITTDDKATHKIYMDKNKVLFNALYFIL